MDFLNTSRNRAMLRFAGWYLLSVVLLGIVAFALWRNGSITWESNQNTRLESEASYVETDVALYTRLQAVEAAYGQYLAQKNEGTTNALATARTDFAAAMESLRKQVQLRQDEKARQDLEELIGRYDASFKLKTSIYSRLGEMTAKGGDTAAGSAASTGLVNTTGNTAVENLKAQLAEKDRIIASLQNSGTGNPPSAGDDEWKKKYGALKTAHDKAVANEQQLRTAYQTIIKDNQRLLQQLQTLRKE